MPLSRQKTKRILLAYQLDAYYAEVKNPHRDLLSTNVSNLIRLVISKNHLSLPRHNLYLSDWALTKQDLSRAVVDFLKLAEVLLRQTPLRDIQSSS
jgi:hypothetical protein